MLLPPRHGQRRRAVGAGPSPLALSRFAIRLTSAAVPARGSVPPRCLRSAANNPGYCLHVITADGTVTHTTILAFNFAPRGPPRLRFLFHARQCDPACLHTAATPPPVCLHVIRAKGNGFTSDILPLPNPNRPTTTQALAFPSLALYPECAPRKRGMFPHRRTKKLESLESSPTTE